MRIIDADEFKEKVQKHLYALAYNGAHTINLKTLGWWLDSMPTIPTKQIKYFDEDEKVWKIGNIINQ